MGWDIQYAIRMIRMIEDSGIHLSWVEEPVIPDDIRGYSQIREAVHTRTSGGENEFTRYGFRELIQRVAVDIVQVDVTRCGGITEARKIWAMAAAYDLPVIPHMGTLHNYHLIISHMNSPLSRVLSTTRRRPLPIGMKCLCGSFLGNLEHKTGSLHCLKPQV